MYFARIIYSKTCAFKIIGHLDTLCHLQKALRRMNIDFVTGKGYRMKIKYSASPALPLGVESLCEFIDVALTKNYPRSYLMDEAISHFPPGLSVKEVFLSEKKFPSPVGCVYEKKRTIAGIFKFRKKIKIMFGEDKKKKIIYPAVRVAFIYN